MLCFIMVMYCILILILGMEVISVFMILMIEEYGKILVIIDLYNRLINVGM